MNLHNQKVLKAADEFLGERKLKRTFGTEIESTRLDLVDEKTREEYKRLYDLAKKHNPEIWKCDVYNLPSEAYYKNRDFFDLLYKISQVKFLCQCYPEEKERIKHIYANSTWRFCFEIGEMYDHLSWYLKWHDEVLPFKKLCEHVNAQNEIYEKNTISSIPIDKPSWEK